MQKMMQKLLTRNISDESLGISTISILICLQTREIHRKHNAPCDYTYTERNQGSSLGYLQILRDLLIQIHVTKSAAKRHVLGHTFQ
jgi:hypothetical protein